MRCNIEMLSACYSPPIFCALDGSVSPWVCHLRDRKRRLQLAQWLHTRASPQERRERHPTAHGGGFGTTKTFSFDLYTTMPRTPSPRRTTVKCIMHRLRKAPTSHEPLAHAASSGPCGWS